ncbi:PA domain [Dillenia turbinata]|uniref:PA domain n=1 Tax=Dillenia turbinata TaxID=194707 RepID=A0AAN8VPD0_9MAGN
MNGSPASAECNKGSLGDVDVKGKILVCEGDLWDDTNLEKGQVVKDAGGAAMILINAEETGYITSPLLHVLPATSIPYPAGHKIKNVRNKVPSLGKISHASSTSISGKWLIQKAIAVQCSLWRDYAKQVASGPNQLRFAKLVGFAHRRDEILITTFILKETASAEPTIVSISHRFGSRENCQQQLLKIPWEEGKKVELVEERGFAAVSHSKGYQTVLRQQHLEMLVRSAVQCPSTSDIINILTWKSNPLPELTIWHRMVHFPDHRTQQRTALLGGKARRIDALYKCNLMIETFKSEKSSHLNPHENLGGDMIGMILAG